MAKILVFVEASDNELKKSSAELLNFFQSSGHEVSAVSTSQLSADAEAKCASYGVQKLYSASLEAYHPDTFTQTLLEAMEKSGATWVFASTSSLSKDIFPRLAARVDGAFVSDVTDVQAEGEDLKLRRPMYSGKCSAAVEFLGSGVRIVLVRPNQLPAGGGTASSSMEKIALNPAGATSSLQLKEVQQGASTRVDLTEADTIISGGRGMKEPGNFQLLEEVADLLGATVGASRAVVDAGWVDHSMQVGQTGKTVAPSLYIACGISGAVQHLAGMSSSKVIVAVNNDSAAPIFQKSTYGVVADVLEFLPEFRDQLKAFL